RDERRRNAADVALHLEPFLLEELLDRGGGLVFLESGLGVLPDLAGESFPPSASLIEVSVGRGSGDEKRKGEHGCPPGRRRVHKTRYRVPHGALPPNARAAIVRRAGSDALEARVGAAARR